MCTKYVATMCTKMHTFVHNKSGLDTTEAQTLGQRSLNSQIYPLVTELLQKYISSLKYNKNHTRNPRLCLHFETPQLLIFLISMLRIIRVL